MMRKHYQILRPVFSNHNREVISDYIFYRYFMRCLLENIQELLICKLGKTYLLVNSENSPYCYCFKPGKNEQYKNKFDKIYF